MFYYMTAIPSLATQEVGGIMGMFSAMLLMMVAYLVTFVVINLAGMHYIKSYIENNWTSKPRRSYKKNKRTFLVFYGFGTLSGIVIVISFLLCFFLYFILGQYYL